MPVVTASLWREAGDDCWRVGEIEYPDGESGPDGSAHLFELLMDPSPEAFQRFAEDYYGVIVCCSASKVGHVSSVLPMEIDRFAPTPIYQHRSPGSSVSGSRRAS